ncbi:MAG TPA: TonB-dependent receptor [Caulobacteraceae bacterium]
MFDRKLLLATSIIAGLGATLTLPAAAFAQDTTAEAEASTAVNQGQSPEEATAQLAASDNDDAVTEVEGLVVTGSRIRRNEFTSPAPITVITREQATLEGLTDTAELLQTATIASGSYQLNNQLGGYVIEGGGGVNSISLRGLGQQRTLVLVNGRRAGPAGVGGQVGAFDLNVIPQSVVERVEILKDGASSIYGSDAIAGVVNIITRDKMDGGNFEMTYSQPLNSGGEQLRAAGAYGKTFDRGQFTISLDYWKQYELEQGDRDYLSCSNDYYHAMNGDLVDITSRRTGKPFCYQNSVFNAVYLPDWLTYVQYDPTGANGPYDPFTGLFSDFGIAPPDWYLAAAPDSIYEEFATNYYGAGSYNYSTYEYFNVDERIDAGNSVIPPLERVTVFGTGSFDLTPTTELYGEVLLNRRKSRQDSLRGVAPTIRAGQYGNPFNGITKANPYVDNVPFNFEQNVDYSRLLGGMRGKFGEMAFLGGWDWDVVAQYSRSDATYENDALLDDAMYAAGDSESAYAKTHSINAGGCGAVPVTPISGRTCVPIAWFDPDTMANGLTQEQLNFLQYRAKGSTLYTQTNVEATISGDAFKLPAGPVGAALGVSWRKDEIDDTPDQYAQVQNLWGQTTAGRTAGTDSVREVFGEVEAPLLRGKPFAEDVTFNASARWTDYDSYGENTTYKLGLDWRMSSQFRIRGTYGTSFRAPALYEMYLASLTGFQSQVNVDPCIHYEDAADPVLEAHCAAEGINPGYVGVGGSATVTQGGGGKGFLDPETSIAQSFGIVYTPDWIDLSVAIDYFDIRVKDEVAQFGAGNIVNLCYVLDAYPNEFCDLFVRNSDPTSPDYHSIESINDNYINVAEQQNRGYDLNVRYKRELPWGVDMTLNGQATWTIEDITDFSTIATLNSNGLAVEPAFTAEASMRFDKDDWTVLWSVDHVGHQFPGEPITGATSRYPEDIVFKRWRESTTYHHLSLRKRWDTLEIVGGVRNLFDEHPPAASFGEFRTGTAALNNYDLIGRRVFINISKSF